MYIWTISSASRLRHFRLDISGRETERAAYVQPPSCSIQTASTTQPTVWFKNPPWGVRSSDIFSQTVGNFTGLLHVPIYARLQIFIQLSATLTKLCYIKRDHPVHIICPKCQPLAEAHAGCGGRQVVLHNGITSSQLKIIGKKFVV